MLLILLHLSSNGYVSLSYTPTIRFENIFLISSIGSWSLNNRYLGRPATLFRVVMKCVQNALTVVLGAKASATRQPVKCG